MKTPALRALMAVASTVALVHVAPNVAAQAGAPAGRTAQQPTAFRSQTDAVFVDVSVKQARRPIATLTAADFEVLDNGVLQDVQDLSYEKLPIDVTIALDVSSSVSGALLTELRRAIGQFSNGLRAGDRVKLMAFNSMVVRLVDFSAGPVDARTVFARLPAYGSTSILDSLSLALVSPAQPDRRHLIIVFSDGLDTASINHTGVLLDVIERTTATVAFVSPALRFVREPVDVGPAFDTGTIDPALPPEYAARQRVSQTSRLWNLYRQMARNSGGQVVQYLGNADLTGIFGQVLDDFRSSYVLHFTSRGAGGAGFHPLTVRIKRSGTYEVRARRGYFAD